MAGIPRPYPRGGSAPRRRKQTQIGRMLQDYFQPAMHTTDFNALASGGDISTVLVDNSSDFSNKVLKWSKLVIRPIWDANDLFGSTLECRTLLMAVLKQDQDDTSVYSMDDQETIRELRNKKRLVRGPWPITSPRLQNSGFVPLMAGHMKPIVLRSKKNLPFVLDKEEDLIVTFTNISELFAGTSQALDYHMHGWVRVIN